MMKGEVIPLYLATALYIWQASNFYAGGKIGLMVGFIAYAVANVGFILAARGI